MKMRRLEWNKNQIFVVVVISFRLGFPRFWGGVLMGSLLFQFFALMGRVE